MNKDGFKIDKTDTETLLLVKFDKKLTFDYHNSNLCKKAGRKIPALARVTPCMGIVKKRIRCSGTRTHNHLVRKGVP